MEPKIKVLFILPEILGPGGQELENIGFAKSLTSDSRFEVEILNFFNAMSISEFDKLHQSTWSFLSLKHVFLSKQFLKIFVKSKYKLNQSLANCFRNFPQLFDSWFQEKIKDVDICFTGISPTHLLEHLLQLCDEMQVPFAYHETSIFHQKNHSFYSQLEKKGTFLISAQEKEEYLKKYYPDASYCTIRQWIYLGQTDFLLIPSKQPEKVRFGSVGRVDEGKNFLKILEAISILNQKGFPVEFVLFGDGPDLSNLQNFVEENGLEDSVTLKGAIPFDKRATSFENFDVFILTSNFEGGPLVILEAMAASKPIISTLVGDVPNRVLDGLNGYTLPVSCTAEEICLRMENYILNKVKVKEHGMKSRELFLEKFVNHTNEEVFKESLMKVLGRKKHVEFS